MNDDARDMYNGLDRTLAICDHTWWCFYAIPIYVSWHVRELLWDIKGMPQEMPSDLMVYLKRIRPCLEPEVLSGSASIRD